MKQQELIKGIHYYFNDYGNIVFTKQYLLEKGSCCGMGCLHCPYNYENVAEHLKNDLINARIKKENS
jgi:hypothetical protein